MVFSFIRNTCRFLVAESNKGYLLESPDGRVSTKVIVHSFREELSVRSKSYWSWSTLVQEHIYKRDKAASTIWIDVGIYTRCIFCFTVNPWYWFGFTTYDRVAWVSGTTYVKTFYLKGIKGLQFCITISNYIMIWITFVTNPCWFSLHFWDQENTDKHDKNLKWFQYFFC